MTLNLFAWLRRKVAESILGGVHDALETLDAPPGPDSDRPVLTLPDALAARLLPAVPAASASLPGAPAESGRNGRKSAK